MNEHLERARQALEIAESGDSRKEAYRVAAEEIAAHIAESGDTQEFVATNLGMSTMKVSRLLAWRGRGFDTESPYDEGPEKRQQVRARASHAKRVLRDPEERKQVISSLTPAERTEIVQSVMEDDPEVEEAVEVQVERKQAQRRFETQQRVASASSGTPLSAFFWRIVGTMHQWARDLGVIREELNTLSDSEKTKVIEAHRELIAAAEANLVELGVGKPQVSEAVIEGKIA